MYNDHSGFASKGTASVKTSVEVTGVSPPGAILQHVSVGNYELRNQGTGQFQLINAGGILALTSANSQSVLMQTGSGTNRLSCTSLGSVVIGNSVSSLAVDATDGFLYIPTYYGTAVPGGTPTSHGSISAIVFNGTTKSLHVWNGAGTWSGVSLT